MAGLSDKLKALGVTIGARDLQPPAPTTEHPIEVVVDGSFQQTSAGDIFVIEQLYDTDYRHGQIGLWPTTSLNSIAQWAKDIRIPTYNLEQFAFIDTETTGLAGGTGTYAFLIGVGRFEGDKFRLAQFFMQDPAEEKAQLAALTEFLNPCEALVTFNGKSFDIPLINSRYITHRQQFPLPDAAHIDLLHLARRLWRDRLPSRTLSQLEIHILGANRTEEDTPGWMIPNLYFNYLRTGDARPLKGIFYHNALDILALAALLNHTAYLLTDPLSNSISHALDLVAIGKLFEDLGEAEVAIALFNEGLTRNDLPEESYWHIQQRLSLVYKRQGNLEQAVEVWSLAAEGKQLARRRRPPETAF
ncbi:MAG: ribonuclease H-like domain-containing protein [Chloroflexota bacterium]